MIDWNSLRIILAIEKTGSLQRAADYLGMNHSTVFRRLNELESQLGYKVFSRAHGTYSATIDGLRLVHIARDTELEIEQAISGANGIEQDLKGSLRITTTNNLWRDFVAPYVAEFLQEYPQVHLEANLTAKVLDLNRFESEVAVRPAAVVSGDLEGKMLTESEFRYFAAEQYLSGRIRPKGLYDLRGQTVILASGPIAKLSSYKQFEESAKQQGCQIVRISSFEGIVDAMIEGIGVALLPVSYPPKVGCIELFEANAETAGVWAGCHRDLSRQPVVRRFLDHLYDKHGV